MNHHTVTRNINDFEGFIERNGHFASPFGRWARETKWPIKLACACCGQSFELEKSDINGKSGIWAGDEYYFIGLLLECPHCTKNDLFQIYPILQRGLP